MGTSEKKKKKKEERPKKKKNKLGSAFGRFAVYTVSTDSGVKTVCIGY